MAKVLILGSNGQIAQHAVRLMEARGDELTLYARSKHRYVPEGAQAISADVLDEAALRQAIAGQDIVYANLAGEIEAQAKAIVAAMDAEGVKRLIFVTSIGIYDEVPGAFGEWNNAMIGSVLKDYRKAADVIEASDLDYTVLRPAWLTNKDETVYGVTHRHDPFTNTEVSRQAVAALVRDIVADPSIGSRDSLGVHKPGTEGPKPSFY
ncbi:MAG: NAD(P)H-binding protein [Rothia sp. (in: high G+C Gram-positive bacteria)]|uniref:NAD(P)H-binding protein n=1 Tax=Rothia sp. (in: high G+C Gram-positive bacteria) TaxID=1885016 RepID=UPI0026E06F0D|nr:NAD(P)H-binding protein [Rothia sp. (in: high G+C Gram-positive bacteria)]MDO5749688.1 NAD(P)H-binding protein [Rothia sp. (in: high G+C Gram-positive bacteria)]